MSSVSSLSFTELEGKQEILFQHLAAPITIRMKREKGGTGPLACYFLNTTKHSWERAGTMLVNQNQYYFECETSHLTDFAVLLGGHTDDDDNPIWNSEDLVMSILSAIFIAVALLMIIVIISIFLMFPNLRRFVLECQTPQQSRRKQAKMKARISAHAMQQYKL